MAITKVKAKTFSGTSHIFDGTLEAKLNEIIDGVNSGGGGGGGDTYTDAKAVAAVANKTAIAALTPIADPSTATASDIATALNAVIAALKATS